MAVGRQATACAMAPPTSYELYKFGEHLYISLFILLKYKCLNEQ